MKDAMARLRRTYDPQRLISDLLEVRNIRGRPAGYPGEAHEGWHSVTLYESGRRQDGSLDISLSQTPYFASILDDLLCPKYLVRLMALEPEGTIAEHADQFLGPKYGLVRLHIPIVTDPAVEFFVGGQRCHWNAGELWYGDFSQPHRARNLSPTTRVHMVLDVPLDDFVLSLFPPGFVQKHMAEYGFAMPAVDTRDQALERFSFNFMLPADFVPPGTNFPPLSESLKAGIRVYHRKLTLFVNGQPMLQTEPVSGCEMVVLGLTPESRIKCQFEGDVVKAAYWTVAGEDSRIVLQVRESEDASEELGTDHVFSRQTAQGDCPVGQPNLG